ncbi:alpha/beta fold hydrolase [Allorhodopirellula solitaria]|uniref:4,5:9,10-diseco-3-hydroxy-5,9, 17-trioxoandrosta-1(10),2-diene-4-oate hydrolase n=1 Tax=Allorhodopirellula solitaria TaxID=2527987 RepID=A0A5C5XRE5_9BACT|nr:alpha/beta hydrolase [Allorhodopirellula solitaria]TWT65228.1 4,5:9,10-diseco-3-hydroxy-5,9,17-trioxoandrosta-1(10),2-diene-4-oate hydrolase [Allorhodopirellula solitaria]
MDLQTFRNRQQTVSLDGLIDDSLTLAYTDVGEGEPLLLLHGIPTWSYLFHEIIDPLAEHYRVIAIDMAGYGYSDRRDRFDRSIEFQADVVERFLAQLNIPSAHFIAHDIGGGVALILADRSPETVRSMVLSNSVAYDSWPIDEMLELGHPRNAKMSPEDIKQLLEESFQVGLSRPERLTDEFREGITGPYLDREGIVSMVRNASSLNTNHTTRLTERLNQMPQPTLLLWGVDDNWQPISTAEKLVKDIPNAQLHAVKNCSHWVPQDAPEEFVDSTLDFLSKATSNTTND